MNFIDRFKERQTVSLTVEVESAPLKIEIARFSEVEMVNARMKARALMRQEGLDPDIATDKESSVCLGLALTEYLQRHVKGWKPLVEGTEVPAFSKAMCEKLFAEMDEVERVLLAWNYITACKADAEKKRAIPDSVPSGANS